MKKLVMILFMLLAIITAPVIADGGSEHRLKHRPLMLGTSGSSLFDRTSSYCCGGTLGAVVTDGISYYVLSNNHILGRVNAAQIGEPIVQPGLLDVGCSNRQEDIIGSLTYFVDIEFAQDGSYLNNYVDCAMARLQPEYVSVDNIPEILDIGLVNGLDIAVRVGMNVKKSGRTSGLTFGSVVSTNVDAIINYKSDCGSSITQPALFIDQILISPGSFSAGGDSGSLIVEDVDFLPHPVALLFAGSSSYTLANPISIVLQSLGVYFPGERTNPDPDPDPLFGDIEGVITNKKKRPIESAIIKLDGQLVDESDAVGKYRIEDVEEGDHSIEVSIEGYRTKSKTIIVEGDSVSIVNFVMMPAKGNKGKPPKGKNKSLNFKDIVALKRQNRSKIFSMDDVVGTGIGKNKEGKTVIEVYLKKENVSTRKKVIACFENIPVQVIITGSFDSY